jgi:adenine-specific DNA-methyltransferase
MEQRYPKDAVMPARIRYMGNKHMLAPAVARLVARQPNTSPLIDLFCGMCSIGAAVAPSQRSVWGNDIQAYAALAARCQLTSASPPLRSSSLASVLAGLFAENASQLRARFREELAAERSALGSRRVSSYLKAYEAWPHAANNSAVKAEVAQLAETPDASPYRLFSLSFAWGYFGLAQAIEIDSIRYAIDRAFAEGRLTSSQRDWALLALAQAVSHCSSGPGHFAQYLKGTTQASLSRILRQRERHPWDSFLRAADDHHPFGSRSWRRHNQVLQEDALTIWDSLDRHDLPHAVIYADPPYSKDHYSRYYHVLETLVRYDYPDASGIGRYRPDRHATAFSIKRQVADAFDDLCSAVADREWTLILSYPSTGLFSSATGQPVESVLRDKFPSVTLEIDTAISHSTLGARHGRATRQATEYVWVAS